MNNVQNSRPTQPVANNTTQKTAPTADLDAAPMAAPQADQAAAFDRTAKKSSLFGSHNGGDSRVVSPAGGGLGEVNQHEAIDAHSKKEGDFTEPRTVGEKSLFFTPDGARAIDNLLERAKDSSAPLHAESDPSFWRKVFGGDLFDGLEQFSGNTK